MSNGLDALRVAVGIDVFWTRVRSLPKLGMIASTCKTLRRECDLAFAVTVMRKDRRIPKVWAKRWFGFNGYRFSKGVHPTLVSALKILASLGGLEARGHVALAAREKEAQQRVIREKEKELALERAREARARRKAELDRRMDAMHLPKEGFFYDMIAEGSVAVDDALMRQLVRKHARETKHAAVRCQRKKTLDTMLAKEKIECSGYYYDKCIWNVNTQIDAEMLQELGITRHDSLLNQIVRDLRNRAGHYFQGIYARARDVIAKGSYVNAAGQRVWKEWEIWAHLEH